MLTEQDVMGMFPFPSDLCLACVALVEAGALDLDELRRRIAPGVPAEAATCAVVCESAEGREAVLASLRAHAAALRSQGNNEAAAPADALALRFSEAHRAPESIVFA